MECDFYGLQKQRWRSIRSQKTEVNELVEENQIPKEEDTEEVLNTPEIITNENIEIEQQDIQTALQKLKNRKSPGQDGIPNELLDYGRESLIQLTKLTQKMFYQQRIPNEWRTSTTILMFKKGDKKHISMEE